MALTTCSLRADQVLLSFEGDENFDQSVSPEGTLGVVVPERPKTKYHVAIKRTIPVTQSFSDLRRFDAG